MFLPQKNSFLELVTESTKQAAQAVRVLNSNGNKLNS